MEEDSFFILASLLLIVTIYNCILFVDREYDNNLLTGNMITIEVGMSMIDVLYFGAFMISGFFEARGAFAPLEHYKAPARKLQSRAPQVR